ncbi:hypothetical protein M5362_06405 [Streptomyces sp. Je 1-79]|uniref:hypothetical protein n=1 Tax=Streptomyces sp. Je 1-79 TaxID=2943847 RepID=UPI0021A38241|nr:hypothetical protein [Streptomyces sp. Je 1-79]MCT4352760.1 hypothetical protein [Streptomyces sp. Je 1-79]
MRTRIRHGLAAALTVSALFLVAACSGGSDGTGDTTKEKAADKPAAEQTTSAAPAAATPLTAAQMKAAVLELKDLPSGWKTTKRDAAPTVYKVDKPECQTLAPMLSGDIAGATEGASGDFAVGDNASEITQTVVTFEGTGAADYIKKLGDALDACPAFTAEADGNKTKMAVKKITAPQGAEEALAFQLSLEVAPGIKVEPNLIVVRQGSGVMRFLHLADAATAKKDFDGLAKLATDKFVKGAQS